METKSIFTNKEVAQIDEEIHNEMIIFRKIPSVSISDGDVLTALRILTTKVLRDKHEGFPIGAMLEELRDLLDSCIDELKEYEANLYSSNDSIEWGEVKREASLKVKEKLMESAGMK